MLGTFELKQAELLTAIIDSIQDPVVSQDLNGTLISWNKGAQALLGYTAEEVLGKACTAVAPQLTSRRLKALVQQLQAGSVIDNCQAHFRTKDGPSIPVVLNFSLLHAFGSQVVGTSMVVKQTAREHSTQHDLVSLNAELLQSERRFGIFSETLADILWSMDASGQNFGYLSRRFGEYTGLTSESISQRSWMELLHADDRASAEKAWQEAREAGQRFQVEFRLRRIDGAYRWFVGRGTPVRNESGEIVQWVGTCTDIDDLKRGEEALRRSNRELKQFAYAAAHDLQEPLRNVATSVSMLRRHYESQLDPNGMEWIDASIEGAHRLYAMVKDLLTFSTIIDDEITSAEDERVPLRSAVEAALVEISSEVESAAPDVRIGELPALAVQWTHAVRLFQNIIGNSLKYRRSDVRPIIELSAIPSGTDWTLSVKDNGIGFDPVYATTIFGVFKRLHGRDVYPGNGIGLAICERIVAHYGGRIWAEGIPGQGATFHFTLPGLPAPQ